MTLNFLMKLTRQSLVILMMFLLLVGCQKKFNYSYLMRHPETLKKEIKYCEVNDVSSSKKQTNECQIVILAAENMLSILEEQQESPEKFGERLLNLQISFNKAKIALDETEKSLMSLQKQNAKAEKINEEKEKRDRLKKLYDEQREEIEVMLAVIGINTPG